MVAESCRAGARRGPVQPRSHVSRRQRGSKGRRQGRGMVSESRHTGIRQGPVQPRSHVWAWQRSSKKRCPSLCLVPPSSLSSLGNEAGAEVGRGSRALMKAFFFRRKFAGIHFPLPKIPVSARPDLAQADLRGAREVFEREEP